MTSFFARSNFAIVVNGSVIFNFIGVYEYFETYTCLRMKFMKINCFFVVTKGLIIEISINRLIRTNYKVSAASIKFSQFLHEIYINWS